MKKITLLLAVLFVTHLPAQNLLDDATSDVITVAENSKSGNYKDVLASVFQLAARNFVGEDKSLEFNTTLFALKLKANPEINRDVFFVNETFSRNLQMNFKAYFNDEYRYMGFTGGITYALYNGRDSKIVKMNDAFVNIFNQIDADLNTAQQAIGSTIVRENISKAERTIKWAALSNAKEAILNNITVTDSLTNAYKSTMLAGTYNNTQNLVNSGGAQVTTLQGASLYLNEAADLFYEELKSAPLLTFAVDGTSNEDGKFNRASAALIYLQGVKKSDFEIDIRTKFSYSDTLQVSMPRKLFEAEAGINFILGRRSGALSVMKDTTRKSFFEIKSYMEYKTVINNRLTDEEEHNFSANADLRLRIAEDLWIPLTIKYDIENANVFGFLNISYNFE